MVGCFVFAGCVDEVSEPETGSKDSNLIGLNQIGLNQIGLNQIGLNQIGLNQIGLNQIGLNQIGLNQIGLNQIGLNQIGLNGVAFNQIGLNQIGLNGVTFNQIGLNQIGLNQIGLNQIGLNGVVIDQVSLSAMRLNGLTLNGLDLYQTSINGVSFKGLRLGGVSLQGLQLATARLNGAPLDAAETSQLKLALSYVVSCALPAGQCRTVTDVDGSTFQLCGSSGLDPAWDTDLVASVANEEAVTQCVIDVASSVPSNAISHANREALVAKDFFTHAASCALPSGTCVTAIDADGIPFQMCGSQGLDPAWQTGPATAGAVYEQVTACVRAEATGHGDAWLDYRDQLKMVLQYAVQCALPAGQTVTVVDWDGTEEEWSGAFGLAPWWGSAPLAPAPAPKPASAGEELVSACLMARTNAVGRSVSLSIRARPEIAATPEEAAAYGRHEGAFMGNLFSATPMARSCSAPGGNGWIWDPATNGALTAGRQCAAGTDCGFEYVGSCTSVCNVKPGVGGETLFDECAGNAHVVNTFLYSAQGFDVSTASPTYHPAGQGTKAPMVATGDFNADGNADLAIENGSRSLIVRLGKKEGGFAPDAVYDLGSSVLTQWVIAKDLNADGKLDLVTANTDSLSVLLGNGNGSFGAPARYPVSSSPGYMTSVVAMDVNSDGKVDLATNLTTGMGVFLGNGNGTFGAQIFTGGGLLPSSLVGGDFNGDGKMDLASGSWGGSPVVYVSWGSGNGVFGPTSTITVGGSGASARALTVGDFNRDGRADLAVAVKGDNTVKVLLGQANKSFTTQTYAIAGAGDTTFVAAAYLDGNTAVDLLVIRGSSIVRLSGAGNGTFSTAGTFNVGEAASQVVAGYFDRDATWRIDLLVSSSAGRLVQLNGV